MKVLFLHDKYVRNGGAERYISLKRTQLEKEGHNTFLFTLTYEEGLEINNSKIMKLGRNGLFGSYNQMIPVFLELRKYIKEVRPDVVYIQNNYEFPYSFLEACRGYKTLLVAQDYGVVCPTRWCVYKDTMGVCCGKPGIKCLMHGCIAPHLLLSCFLKIQYTKRRGLIDEYLTCSETLRKYMIDNGFQNVGLERIPLRIEEGDEKIKRERSLFIYVGGLYNHKGVYLLIEAMKEVVSRDSTVRLEMIGSGPEEGGIRAKIREYGLERNVKLAGKIENDQMYRYYKKAAATIVPSIWMETYPYAVAESIHFKTQVIGSDIGGIREQIDSPEKGMLFERNKKEDLVRKILDVSRKGMIVPEPEK